MRRLTVVAASLLVCVGGAAVVRGQERPKSLHDAARAGDLEQLKQYVDKKANLNAEERGYTPLKCAVESYHLDAVKLLLQGGANPNAKDGDGATPLFLACTTGQKEVVEVLLAGKADVGAKDRSGRTPLYFAVMMGQLEIAEMLIKGGADVNATDQGGQTPLLIAQQRNMPEMADLLKKHGGTAPNLQDRYAAYGEMGGAAQAGPAVTGSQSQRPADFEIDPNAIREQLKKFSALDAPLKAADANSEIEQRAWAARRLDNRTMMLRAVQKQFEEEMALVKRLANEEKAAETGKAIGDLVTARKSRYELIGRELREQRRQTLQDSRDSMTTTRGGRGGSMTGGRGTTTGGRSTTRGGRSSGMNATGQDPYGAPQQTRASRRPAAAAEAEEVPIDADSQAQIQAWLNAKPEDKADLLQATHELDIVEYAALHESAVEEKAVKTDAAIMGLLMQRQERIARIQQKWQEEDERMQKLQERTGTTNTMQGAQPGMQPGTQRGTRGRGGRM